jgi:hypothetical protein
MSHALWVHARPRLLPYVLALTAAGWGWAHWDRALSLRGGGTFLLVLLSWTLLHAGTLWLNAALDRDEGEVLMGQSAPIPPHIVGFGYAALSLSAVVGAAASPLSGAAAAICAVLAVLYSNPKTAWKQHPWGGPFVNLVGYGLLSPLAGWAVAEVAVNARTVLVWCLGASGVLGCYFAAQAFQQAEDAARGYRTLVVTHGPVATLLAARCLVGAGFLGGASLAAVGWLPRVCLVGVPLAFWIDRWFARWARQPGGGDEGWARGLAKRLLLAGLLALGLTFGEYARESYAGGPVAGLGTASGHPFDRPALSPWGLARWELEMREQSHRDAAGVAEAR